MTTESQEERKGGLFARLRQGLSKTRQSLAGGLDNLIHGRAVVGPELMEELEEALLISDAGMTTTRKILDALEEAVASHRLRESGQVMEYLKRILIDLLEAPQTPIDWQAHRPFVVLMIGINGSGKTTTIGKLAWAWTREGHKVLLAAGDTFRAAAIDQLQLWADRAGVPCIRQAGGADPSAVAFDAVQAAVARNLDRVLIDTAGRLQTNVNLMEELKKIKRVLGKVLPGAPHATWLVLDAGIGQNSIAQAKQFHEALGVDGLIMTKLDGTARGGVLLNITDTLKLPVRYIGVGEQPEELQVFDPKAFVEALLAP